MIHSSMTTRHHTRMSGRALAETYGITASASLASHPVTSGFTQQSRFLSMWVPSNILGWREHPSLRRVIDKQNQATPLLTAAHKDSCWLPLLESDLKADYFEAGVLFYTDPGALEDLAEQRAAERVQSELREKKKADAALAIIKIIRSRKFTVAQADYQRNKAAAVLRRQGAQLAQENVQLRRYLRQSYQQRMASQQDLQSVQYALMATRRQANHWALRFNMGRCSLKKKQSRLTALERRLKRKSVRVHELKTCTSYLTQALTENEAALDQHRAEADVVALWKGRFEAAQATINNSQDRASQLEEQLRATRVEVHQLDLSSMQQTQENERLALKVERLEKLNMPASQKMHDTWGPCDAGIQQHKADVPPSPCCPLQFTSPTYQVVDGANEGSVGSPGFSDDDSIRDLGSEHGESMAELQRQVQKWQDESWELCQSLEAKEIELDEALEREEGLKSSLTSLQHHLHLHGHLITVPTSPLDTDWVIGQEMGRGANAVVLAASHPCMPDVVLKKGFLDNLEAEAHKMWLAPHPNLVRMFGMVSTTEEDPSNPSPLVYLALQRLGRNLASLLHSGRRFPIKEQVALLQQVASALAQLHSKGIVHQDLHSDNILQSLDGLQYKVSDLGNAEFCQVDGQPNEIFHSKCGLGIESPQLATDLLLDSQYQPSCSSDMWAFGLLALELTGGSKPAQHQQLVEEYLEAPGQYGHDAITSPAQKQLFTYLMDLVVDDAHGDYADQIKLPPIAPGPDAQAATDLQAVIRGCLTAYACNRLQAADAQKQLFDIEVRHGWTHQASTSSKSKRKRRGKRA